MRHRAQQSHPVGHAVRRRLDALEARVTGHAQGFPRTGADSTGMAGIIIKMNVIPLHPESLIDPVALNDWHPVAIADSLQHILAAGRRVQVSVQSAFGCGYEGPVPQERVVSIVDGRIEDDRLA